jgi:hypothetical protein
MATYKGRLGRYQQQVLIVAMSYGPELTPARLMDYCIVCTRGEKWLTGEAMSRNERRSMCRALRSVGAVRVRRQRGGWVWKLEPEAATNVMDARWLEGGPDAQENTEISN